MYVLITQPAALPTGTYASGAILEIPKEWLNPYTMTRLGATLTGPQQASLTSFATLCPGLRALDRR